MQDQLHTIMFEKISTADAAAFSSAMDIYSDAFPLNERHPVQVIRKRMEHGNYQLYAARYGQEIVFMALLWPLQGTDFVLLDYMATHTAHRGKKIAAFFLHYMKSVLQKNRQYFILETEDQAFGSNKMQRQQRINFYKKNGARELKDVKFMLPALQGTEDTAMLLMIFPAPAKDTINAGLIKNLIVRIFKELYAREEAYALAVSAGYENKVDIELI